MMKEIARALLIHVYHPVSAVVSLDGIGGVMDVFLFDTKFAGARIKVHECAKEVALITNHPEGSMSLYE